MGTKVKLDEVIAPFARPESFSSVSQETQEKDVATALKLNLISQQGLSLLRIDIERLKRHA